MLYERWCRIAQERAEETALVDWGSARRWTFRELWTTAEKVAPSTDLLVFPRGNSPEFVFQVLAGWHHQRAVCPLETGQPPPAVPAPPRGIVHLKLTSATTGPARCVAFTAAQLAADADQIRSTMQLRWEWPNLGVISLAHSYGFSSLVLPLLLHGIPLVLCPSALPEAVRQVALATGPLTLPAVPALWRAWLEADAIPNTLRLAISAGAPLPIPLEKAIHSRQGLKVHNFYGATECGGIAYDRSQAPRQDGQLAGTAMDGVSVSLDEAECLEVRAASVGEGYWPEAVDRLGGGCYRSQDLAELRDGCVWLRGRAGDLIHIAGRKVSPESIESALREHPAVLDCLALGLPMEDDIRQEVVGVVVATRELRDPAPLREFLATRLPAWQVPRAWRLVESLETNTRGKLSRALWRAQWKEAGPS